MEESDLEMLAGNFFAFNIQSIPQAISTIQMIFSRMTYL